MPVVFYDGCLILEIRDFRRVPASTTPGPSSAAASSARHPTSSCCSRSTGSTRRAAERGDRIKIEQRILLSTASRYAGADARVSRIANILHFNRLKGNVKPAPRAHLRAAASSALPASRLSRAALRAPVVPRMTPTGSSFSHNSSCGSGSSGATRATRRRPLAAETYRSCWRTSRTTGGRRRCRTRGADRPLMDGSPGGRGPPAHRHLRAPSPPPLDGLVASDRRDGRHAAAPSVTPLVPVQAPVGARPGEEEFTKRILYYATPGTSASTTRSPRARECAAAARDGQPPINVVSVNFHTKRNTFFGLEIGAGSTRLHGAPDGAAEKLDGAKIIPLQTQQAMQQQAQLAAQAQPRPARGPAPGPGRHAQAMPPAPRTPS
eukprot:tig00021126_g18482.t1